MPKIVPAKPPMDILTFCDKVLKLKRPLWKKQREILQQVFTPDVNTILMLLGRRSGKSYMSAIAAVYGGTVMAQQYRKKLRPGERFRILLVAPTEDQAEALLWTVGELLDGSERLRPLILKRLAKKIFLKNGCVFQVATSSSRSLRGAPIPLAILDEFAHFLDTSGNTSSDQVLQAIRPAMAQFGNDRRLFVPSTPWLKKGAFYDLYLKGQETKFVKVFEYKTRDVNEEISEETLRQEFELNPQSYLTEYECRWAEESSAFIDSSMVDVCTRYDRFELPAQDNYIMRIPNSKYDEQVEALYHQGYQSYQIEELLPKILEGNWRSPYYLSLDPAKGHRDAYTACIGHYEFRQKADVTVDVFVVDVWLQFSASVVDGKRRYIDIDEVHQWILARDKEYNFATIVLDQYQSLATIQHLKNKVTQIDELTWTQPRKQEAFSKLRDLIYSNRIELYGHQVGIQQLKSLVVKLMANGGWTVTGGDGIAVDDYASALAGCIYVAKEREISALVSAAYWSR